MAADRVEAMLCDVSRELLAMVHAAKNDAARSGSDYDKARHLALFDVVSLIVEQADTFGVDRARIGLGGVDPADLLSDRGGT